MSGNYTNKTPGKNGRKADAGPLASFKGKAKAAAGEVKPKGGGTGISRGAGKKR
jgi:hypothetical protein